MTTCFVIVTVPVRVFVVVEFGLRRRAIAVVCGGRNHRVVGAPTAVRAIVLPETGANYLVGFLLRLDVDAGVNGKTTLGHASGVFVFKFLTNEFDWIVKRRRFVLRLVVSGVGQLNRFGLCGVGFSLTCEAVFGHEI